MTAKHWLMLGVAKLLLIGVAIAVVFSIYGCNTVRGIGQDVEKAGQAIQKAVDK